MPEMLHNVKKEVDAESELNLEIETELHDGRKDKKI